MLVTHNTVRMYDTDMAGVIFFANQFRYVHDAIEELFAKEGLNFQELFHTSPFIFVMVHVEADYFKPLILGDHLSIHLTVDHIGTSSVTFKFEIYRKDELVGTAKTTQVCLSKKAGSPIPIPEPFLSKLKQYT